MNRFLISNDDQIWINDLSDKIENKMRMVVNRHKGEIPSTATQGVYDNKADKSIDYGKDDGLNWWTNGFWGGILWMLYNQTKDDNYAKAARNVESMLDKCFETYYGLHHDVGFMWMPTAAADYKLTGNEDAKRRAMHAASLLAGRFNHGGGFIRAWNSYGDQDTRGFAIIDCMMNLSLLYWASEESRDPRFKQIAVLHADKTARYFIRPDGSSNHIIEFDPENGELVRTYGGQGYQNGSAWSRGQAWAVYGFIISYLHTGRQKYLETAIKAADYFIANTPSDSLIPVDFMQPAEADREDSTAAAIAACGMLEISDHVCFELKDHYLKEALRLLKALSEKRCDWNSKTDGILYNCTGSYSDLRKHINFTYADSFFMEAVNKLKGSEFFLW